MQVKIINKQSSLKIEKKLIQKQVIEILKKEKIKTDEVALHFVNTETIKKIHLKHFNDEKSTDCISFPIDKPNHKKIGYSILGEAFINADAAIKFCKAYNKDVFFELTLYIIHSILHLIGYDDINKKDIKIMRKKENYYLSLLKDNLNKL